MRDCQTSTGEWRDDVRASRACKLPGLPPVAPKPNREALYWPTFGSEYRGRYPDKRLIGTDYLGALIDEGNWQKPFEDPADGCPGAWYRTPWVDSVDKYTRHRTDDGGRNAPLRPHERCSPSSPIEGPDWLIQDAIRCLEDEEERAINFVRKVRDDRMERRFKANAAASSPRTAVLPTRAVRSRRRG